MVVCLQECVCVCVCGCGWMLLCVCRRLSLCDRVCMGLVAVHVCVAVCVRECACMHVLFGVESPRSAWELTRVSACVCDPPVLDDLTLL